jgi:hypothetical protein
MMSVVPDIEMTDSSHHPGDVLCTRVHILPANDAARIRVAGDDDADPLDDPELDDNGGQWWPLRSHIASETREIQGTWSVGERNGRGTGRIPLAPEELAALPAAVPFKPRLRPGEFDEAACRVIPDVDQALIGVLAGRELWTYYIATEIESGAHDAGLDRILDALANREAALTSERRQADRKGNDGQS